MDLIYALDLFFIQKLGICRDVRIVLYSKLVHNIYEQGINDDVINEYYKLRFKTLVYGVNETILKSIKA
jgi:hypothetical protein